MLPGLTDLAQSLEKFSDVTPTFTADRCLNQRHRHAGQCAACADACPVAAITLTPTPVFASNACLACGQCSAACPTDALAGVRSLAEMRRKAAVTLDAEGTVTLMCRALGAGDYAAARVPCISALPAEFYIALVMAGARRIQVHTADCDACPYRADLDQVQQVIDTARELLNGVGLEFSVMREVSLPPAAPQKEARGISRRDLFRSLLKPETLRAAERDYIDDLLAAGVGMRRALLLDALSRTTISDTVMLATHTGQWGAVTASDQCIGCQMCAKFCPTKALVSVEGEDGNVSLWFDAARCTACGLCVRACFKSALAFTDDVRLAAVATSEYQPLWQGQPTINPLKSPQTFKVPRPAD